jgi:hypothetical protein
MKMRRRRHNELPVQNVSRDVDEGREEAHGEIPFANFAPIARPL